MEKINYLAIIPARKGSKGIKNKNKTILGSNPLIEWTFKAAHNSTCLDHILLTTDDPEIIELSKKYRIEAPFVRPDSLSKDDSLSSEVILHAVNYLIDYFGVSIENIVKLQPTSPFRNTVDIDSAIKAFSNQKSSTLISVCKPSQHPEDCVYLNDDGTVHKITLAEGEYAGRQSYKEVFFIDGGIYISTLQNFMMTKSFLNEDTLLFEVNKSHGLDIDDYFDLYNAEALLNYAGINDDIWNK